MSRSLSVAVLLVVVSACGASSTATSTEPVNASPTTTSALAAGEQVYVAYCAACHGSDGRGVAGRGSSLIGGEFGEGTDAAARAIIVEGLDALDPSNAMGVAMPPRGGNPRLSDEEVDEVIGYLRSIQD